VSEVSSSSSVYLDTSALLRSVLDSGTTPGLERKIADSERLLTSRLTLVESARAFLRVRGSGDLPESRITDAERSLDSLLDRCEIWELDEEVCDLASRVAPRRTLRSLDALHLATFLLARREVEGLELLTTDRRLQEAAETP
jgi:predicted nucleic acid-binding protein